LTEPLGGHTHGYEHRDGLHFDTADAVLDSVGVIAAEALGHGQASIKKTQVKLARFEDASDSLPGCLSSPHHTCRAGGVEVGTKGRV